MRGKTPFDPHIIVWFFVIWYTFFIVYMSHEGAQKMEDKNTAKIQSISRLALIITITVFSVVLIALDFLLEWEKWTIPIIIASLAGCLITYVMGILPYKTACYVYSIVLMVEVFYYTVKSRTVFECSAVIILMLVILAMTQSRLITWLGFITSYIGVIYGLIYRNNGEMPLFDISYVIRISWHLVLLFIAVFAIEKLLSSIKGIEDGLNKRIETLEEENNAANGFLTNVSHEIRTPVNVIVGMSQLALENESDIAKKERMANIYQAGTRVSEQISDILDFSEIDMHKIKVNEEDYMISSLISDVVTMISPHMKKEVEIVMDVDPALPAVMRSDVSKLKKILFHMISNGIKFTNEGGIFVNIAYEKQSYGINLIITVRDTGIGMEQYDEQNIFRRFYQADSRRTRSSGGLGLGLPIIIGFLRALDGFFYIDSTPHKGSTMRASIPQKVIDDNPCTNIDDRKSICVGAFFYFNKLNNPEVRDFYSVMLRNLAFGTRITSHRADNLANLKRLVETVNFTHLFLGTEEYEKHTDYINSLTSRMNIVVIAEPGDSPDQFPGARIINKPITCFSVVNILNNPAEANTSVEELYLPGIKVLVVDDEPMNLTVCKGIFEKYGMEVTTAQSGMEALSISSKEDFNIVFMDHMMPKMDGVEAMKRLRSEARRRNIDYPIVALTANALSSAREMFLTEGFDAFVSKPIELAELERVLRKLLPVNSSSPKAKKQEPSLAQKLAALGIDYHKGIHYSQDDEDFYKTLLGQFANEAAKKKQTASDMLSSNDFQEYAVVVHSIKGTAKMIGANSISEEALALENAVKSNDFQTIHSGNESFFEKYIFAADGINKILQEYTYIADNIMPQDADIFEFLPAENKES